MPSLDATLSSVLLHSVLLTKCNHQPFSLCPKPHQYLPDEGQCFDSRTDWLTKTSETIPASDAHNVVTVKPQKANHVVGLSWPTWSRVPFWYGLAESFVRAFREATNYHPSAIGFLVLLQCYSIAGNVANFRFRIYPKDMGRIWCVVVRFRFVWFGWHKITMLYNCGTPAWCSKKSAQGLAYGE